MVVSFAPVGIRGGKETSWRLLAINACCEGGGQRASTDCKDRGRNPTHAGLRVVELHSPSESSLRQKAKLGDDEFIELELAVLLA